MSEHDYEQNERGNKPVDVLRDGALKVSIFRNRGENGDSYAMVPGRIYTDKETGDVREATSFNANEALRMSHLMTKSYERVVQHRSQDREENKGQAQDKKEPERGASQRQHSDKGHGRGR